MGRFRPEVMDHNQALLDLIATVAKNRLKENLQASEIVLTKEEMEKLNEALSKLDIDETHF